MAAAPNVYSAELAYPVLASSLLTRSESGTTETARFEKDPNAWSLKEDWELGIRNSAGLFRCGAVIGFSRLRNRSKNNDEYIAQIPRHLLTTHLMRTPSSETRAFIIHPSNFDAFAPWMLLNSLQSTAGQSLSREDAIKRLESVQLLPIHNFPNAAQAIGTISNSLHEIQSRRANVDSVMLIVVGLDTLAEGIIRTSNPVKGTALLAATLRNLTRLSREYASFLSVMLVNTNGLGSPHFDSDKQPERQKGPTEDDTRLSRDDGIHSIFRTPDPPLLSTLLMRTLDQGIDTHILLSDIKSTKVAEVIKDRVGTGLGKWGIWTSK